MDTLRSVIDGSYFSLDHHQRMWAAMCSLYDRGIALDYIVLFAELQERGIAESIGGLSYIAELITGIPDLPNLDRYVEILRKDRRLRWLMAFGETITKRAASQEDPKEIEDFIGTSIQSDSNPDRRAISTREMIDRYGMDDLLKPQRDEGLRLPWHELNKALCGFHPGQMIVLAGDTGKGKSSFALQVATHAAKQGVSPVIWTLEMPPRKMFLRMINQLTSTDANRGRHAALTTEEVARQKEAAYWLYGHPVWFDCHSRNVASFIASIRQAAAKSEVGLAVIDHLQLIRGTGRQSRAQEVSETSRSLKLAAMEMGLPFLVLSQFHRVQDKPTTIHSLKESGDIENDADVILLINCPELEGKTAVTAAIRIGKQREGPAGFDIPLEFRPPSQSFHSLED
jgi:replicative DNA helicase